MVALSKYLYHIHGTGNGATDNANFAKLVAYANAYGGVKIVVTGTLRITGEHTFTVPVWMTCEFNGVIAFDVNGVINFGTLPSLGSTAFTATTQRFSNKITSPNMAFSVGEFCAIKANDELAGGYTPHTLLTGTQHVLELHRIVESEGSNVYELSEQVVDNFTISPTITKIPMIRGTVLENVKYMYVGSTTPSKPSNVDDGNCFYFRRQHGLKLINVQALTPSAGGMWFQYCYDTKIDDLTIDSKYNAPSATGSYQYGYNVILGLVTKFAINGGYMEMCRHGITTTSEATGNGGLQRWGTPLLVTISGMTFQSTRGTAADFVCIDSHSEGYGIIIDSCNYLGHTGTGSTGLLLNNRARQTTVRSCLCDGQSANSQSGVYGILNMAPGLNVERCTFKRGWHGVRENAGAGVNVNGLRVHGSRFEDLLGPAIVSNTGTNNIIEHNTMHNVGSNSFFTYKVAIRLDADPSARILGNIMPKYSNDYAIRLGTSQDANSKVIGNTMTGYGTSIFDPTSADAAALTTKWCRSDKNFVDTIPLPITDKAASFTLALVDSDSQITLSNSSSAVITVPNDSSVAFENGTTIEFFREGAGAVTFAAASGVTIKSRGNLFSMNGQNSAVVLRKLRANVWALAGDRV